METLVTNSIFLLNFRIALNLREQGRGADNPGRLKKTQGIGWWLAEHNIAQISLNLSDYNITPIHEAYEEVSERYVRFQSIFPLANSFGKCKDLRRWQAPYGTRMRRIRTFVGGVRARR